MLRGTCVGSLKMRLLSWCIIATRIGLGHAGILYHLRGAGELTWAILHHGSARACFGLRMPSFAPLTCSQRAA